MSGGAIVGIDLGHGAGALGAVYGGYTEKDLNLAVGLKLEASLMGSAIVPLLTRRADFNPSWGARYQAVSSADFVISVHFNANANAHGLHGAEGYHYPGNDFARQVCLAGVHGMPIELASTKLFAATDEPGPDDDWLERPRVVIEAFRELSVSLIECAYLTNEETDRRFLAQPFALDEIVNGLRSAAMRGAQIIGA